ncbi:MAG: hypothetical protein Q9197_006048, partial [Variospora fuerteventurae]
MTDVVATTYLHQQRTHLSIPAPILSAFSAADRACGFDKVLAQLSYPPKAPIAIPGNPEGLNFLRRKRQHNIPAPTLKSTQNKSKRQAACPPPASPPTTPALIAAAIHAPCALGCATYTTALAYLSAVRPCFDPYNILSTCSNNSSSTLDNGTTTTTTTTGPSSHYLNRADVKRAIHAPPWKTYEECNSTVFETQNAEDVVPPAYAVLPELLRKGVRVHVYSGDLDALLNHWGTELVMANMT